MLYGYFPWAHQCNTEYDFCPNGEPEPPSADNLLLILEAIGAPPAILTVTLMWSAPVDLDLHFSCPNGDEVFYGATSRENCLGTLDSDMQAPHANNVRGDGSIGQIENISLGLGVDQHNYQGRVKYYSGSEDAPFQLIFSGQDPDGVIHVFEQQYVETFTSGQHDYSYTYHQFTDHAV